MAATEIKACLEMEDDFNCIEGNCPLLFKLLARWNDSTWPDINRRTTTQNSFTMTLNFLLESFSWIFRFFYGWKRELANTEKKRCFVFDLVTKESWEDECSRNSEYWCLWGIYQHDLTSSPGRPLKSEGG